MLVYDKEEPVTENLITWVFDENSFVPAAKLVGDKSYSILTDHLGTPYEAYDENGEKVWARELDLYGNAIAGDSLFIPFLYQGQYYDEEIGLAYNRFRYYSPDSGTYISQDPIRLAGGLVFYGYVFDCNEWIDPWGLEKVSPSSISLSHDAKASTTFGGYHSNKTVQDMANDIIEDEVRILDKIKEDPLLKRNELNPYIDGIPVIGVAKVNKAQYSVNNRCLKAFQIAEKALSKLGIDLKIDIRETTKDELKEIKKRIKDKKH